MSLYYAVRAPHSRTPKLFVFPTALGLLSVCLDHPAMLATWADTLNSAFSVGRAVYDSCLSSHSCRISETAPLALSGCLSEGRCELPSSTLWDNRASDFYHRAGIWCPLSTYHLLPPQVLVYTIPYSSVFLNIYVWGQMYPYFWIWSIMLHVLMSSYT